MLATVATPADGGTGRRAILDAIRPGIPRGRAVALPLDQRPRCLILRRSARPVAGIGAIFVLDISTSRLGALPLDLAAVDPDFMVAGGIQMACCALTAFWP